MYDDFSTDYDRFVNWPARLAAEMPFIVRQLQSVGARRVLDAACGTGQHAVALAKVGYDVAGTDFSGSMIERARANAAAAGVAAHFAVAGFGQAASVVGDGFDALLCLGNSLPHVLTPQHLADTLDDFSTCLRPGGLLLVQNRNFDAVLKRQERWMDPQAHKEPGAEWLFLRFYDFKEDDRLKFNVVSLRRMAGESWEQQVRATTLWAMREREVTEALARHGFAGISCFGDMSGAPFDPHQSTNLVVTARSMATEVGQG
jgi:glycine/sarcosine N-methyltransferase